MSYFYVIEIEDLKLRAFLNAIRIVANPYVGSDAHITIRGPYKKRHSFEDKSEYLESCKISAFGIGKFFLPGQNTVYLRCGFSNIDRVWNKPSYHGRNCHLTLYDGGSRAFASELVKVLDKSKFFFIFRGAGLKEIRSENGQKKIDSYLGTDFRIIRATTGFDLSYSKLIDKTESQRLHLIKKIVGEMMIYIGCGQRATLQR